MSITSPQLRLTLGSSTNWSPHVDPSTSKKLFVGGLSVKVGDILLREYFEQFGEIERLVIVKEQGISKGYGFVTFKDPRAAQWATQGRHYLGDKPFSCTYLLTERQAKQQTMADKKRKLFLKNLSFKTKEQTLKAYFEHFGAVERVTINRNLDESSKGSGFVLFEDSSAARSLLKHKLPHQIDGRSVKVYATLTKQEIKEYSAKLDQVQRPSPISGRIELANLGYSNFKAPAVKFTCRGQGMPNQDFCEVQTACQANQTWCPISKWQSASETRLFKQMDQTMPARPKQGFLSATTGDVATLASLRSAQLTTSDDIFCVFGADYMMPTNCLSRSARNSSFKAHAEDSSNLVFRLSNYRVSGTKVTELVLSHSQ